MRGERAGHGNGHHFSNGVVTDHEEGFADGGDDAGVMLEGGIGDAEDAIAEGDVGGDKFFDFAQVGGVAVEGGEELEVDEVVLRDGGGAEEDGLREEIALKEGAAFRDGDAKLDFGFNFFGKEARGRASDHGVEFAARVVVGNLKIDFDEVGEMEEEGARGFGEEAIEGETKALFFESEAGVDHLGIGVDVLRDFKDGGLGGKESDEAFDEGVACAVDEGGGVRGVGNEEQPVVDDLAGRLVGIAGEVVGFAGAEEELVAEEMALGVKDGLAAEEAGGSDGGWACDREVRGRCRFGRRGDGRHAVFATSEYLIR